MRSVDPLILLILGGLLLFGVDALLKQGRSPAIEISAAQLKAIEDEQAVLLGRTPTPAELSELERRWIDEEILFREALAEGLHLRSGDLRGEITELMRLRLVGTLPTPDPEALVNYYAEHLDDYRTEPSLWFEHVFFQQTPAAVEASLTTLNAGEVVAGDAFWQGRRFPGYGRSILNGIFGKAFIDELWTLPTGRWNGPLQSLRGWHFVRVEKRSGAQQLPYAAVAGQVENDYLANIIRTRVDAFLEERRKRYRIETQRSVPGVLSR